MASSRSRPPFALEDALAAASRSTEKGVDVVLPTDCAALAPWTESSSGACVSSPNMPFVPQIPTHRHHTVFSYFGDGMLGPFELMKWPQVFDPFTPHGLAAPANPDLPQPSVVQSHDLPAFDDNTIPWLPWTESFFKPWGGRDYAAVGVLRPDVQMRLVAAHRQAAALVLDVGDRMLPPEDSEGGRQGGYGLEGGSLRRGREDNIGNGGGQRTERKAHNRWGDDHAKKGSSRDGQARAQTFAAQLLLSASRANNILAEVPLSPFQVLQWYREAQRLLLELRAWIWYMTTVKTRIENPLFKASGVLPIRGVITENLAVVSTMHRVGVPVWFVRPANGLTSSTAVARAVSQTPCSVHFSQQSVMTHGDEFRRAPAWVDGPTLDACMEGIGNQVRKYSLSGRPLLRRTVAFADSDREADELRESDPTVPSAPPLWKDLRHTMMISTAGSSQNKNGGNGGVPALAVLRPLRPQAIGSSPPASKRRKVGKAHASVQPPPSLRRPDWMPSACAPWDLVLRSIPEIQRHKASRALLYHLPPIHLFYSDPHTLSHKVHNWIRIRPWCISQAVHPPEGGKVLMTTQQWRFALEGRYFRTAIPGGPLQPQSSRSDLAKLPPLPDCAQLTLGKRERIDDHGLRTPKDGTSAAGHRRALKKACDRVDVHVRFGIQAGFSPYREELDPSPKWGERPVSFEVAKTDQGIWAELTWELSIMNFRLELLSMDRMMLPSAYEQSQDWGKVREEEIMNVWVNDGSVRPRWDRADMDIGLGASTAHGRRPAYERWAKVLASWDGASEAFHVHDDHLEVLVLAFYCRRFYNAFGRTPTLPLVAPLSISRNNVG